jgi:hypothetical protein
MEVMIHGERGKRPLEGGYVMIVGEWPGSYGKETLLIRIKKPLNFRSFYNLLV